MRFLVFILVCALSGSFAQTAAATTVNLMLPLSYQTTDWTPYELTAPDGTPEVVGSEIFEEHHGPNNPLALTGFAELPRPDWARLSFDLTFSVSSHTQAITEGAFELFLPGGTRVTGAEYTRSDGSWAARSLHTAGDFMLSAAAIADLSAHPAPQLTLRGGASAFVSLMPSDPAAPTNLMAAHDLWDQTRLDGTLSGNLQFTMGYGEPMQGAQISSVPLPASGLLMTASLLIILRLKQRI